jgi:hypothetical protein
VEVKLHLKLEQVTQYPSLFPTIYRRIVPRCLVEFLAVLLTWLILVIVVENLGSGTWWSEAVSKCAGILGLFVFVAVIYASIRNRLVRHHADQKTTRDADCFCSLRISDDGLTLEYRHSRHDYRWLAFAELVQTRNTVILRLDADSLLRIPAWAFPSPQEFKSFAEQCRRYFDEAGESVELPAADDPPFMSANIPEL